MKDLMYLVGRLNKKYNDELGSISVYEDGSGVYVSPPGVPMFMWNDEEGFYSILDEIFND